MPLKGDKMGCFASHNDGGPKRIEVVDESMNTEIDGQIGVILMV